MTAEIAILNKSAVALATDSAVTISAGDKEQKIYDSAEKLFDLSHKNPIGIMIYNGMQFMQAPLPMLISEYRQNCKSFERVQDAAVDFLNYLNEWGRNSSERVKDQSIETLLTPVFETIKKRLSQRVEDRFSKSPPPDVGELDKIYSNIIAVFERIYEERPYARFIGGKIIRITKEREKKIKEIVDANFNPDKSSFSQRIFELSKNVILKNLPSGSQTGIVFAGFGSKDIFPSMISFEIEGMVFGRLKYVQTNFVDIDRDGDRARVIPFAQKEMVERFLYGLDQGIERSITQFCKTTVPTIREEILDKLDMSEEDLEALKQDAIEAEKAFVDKLQHKRFDEIRSQSRKEIEDMVEFMPKPELATMAEALVNLTSIKRRVSRGMETVGGPIDVAVISRSEGFIWVKRKHYFESDLNPRYMRRVGAQVELAKGR